MFRLLLVVGARPNFMKISPLIDEIETSGKKIQIMLIHTGQHYDLKMSEVFFSDLKLRKPDKNLEVGKGTPAWQIGEIIKRVEPVMLNYNPDLVVVPGDVNSTMACAIAANKMNIPIAHLEAGLRSYDRTMPEEINRIITDQLSELLLIPSADARNNLIKENHNKNKIHFVGNAMIDSLTRLLPKAKVRINDLRKKYSLKENYIVVTLHRPSNVDNKEKFRNILRSLNKISQKIDVLFPLHPRTKNNILRNNLNLKKDSIKYIEPLGYLDFIALENYSDLIITDSGGIQEESTYLKIPCITLRDNTERPITITSGSNQLLNIEKESLYEIVFKRIDEFSKKSIRIPKFWDGKTSKRIVEIIEKKYL